MRSLSRLVFTWLLGALALSALMAPGATARAAGERDWLLWNTTDGPAVGRWETRWFHLGEHGPEVLAKRTEPMASDGRRVWSLVLARQSVPLRSCECEAGLDAPGCHETGTSTAWSLTAVDLADGTETVVIPAEAEFIGADPAEALALVGSAGAHVFLSRTRGATGCGPDTKPVREFTTYDLGRAARDRRFVADRLPIALVGQAATQLANAFTKCELGFQKSTDEVRRDMGLDGWSLRVRDGGHLRIHWTFSAEAEYLACREARMAIDIESGAMAEAGSLGLASPPPDVIDTALATGQPDGTIVGFAAFAADGGDRDALLARFRGVASHVAVQANEAAVRRIAAEQHSALGRQRSRDGDQAGAIQAFGDALASDPELASAWAGRGRARLLAGADLGGAKSDLEKAFQFIRDTDTQAAVWFDLGQLAERTGDKKQARAAYTSAAAIRPCTLIDDALARLP